MAELTRRHFLATSVAVACSLTVAGRTLAAPASRPSSRPGTGTEPRGFDAGPLAKIKPGINDGFARSKYAMVIRTTDGSIYAISAVCTHQGGNLVSNTGGKNLRCLKHGATFDLTGKVTKGPAREPLSRYAVAEWKDHLFVDTNTILFAEDFDKPNASVKVK